MEMRTKMEYHNIAISNTEIHHLHGIGGQTNKLMSENYDNFFFP